MKSYWLCGLDHSKHATPARRWLLIAMALLVFLFPLFVASVRHWPTWIHGVAAILSLFLVRGGSPLTNREKTLLWAIGVYVAVSWSANTVSGWTAASVRWMLADIRVLFAIPLYLALRQIPNVSRLLWYSVPFAGIIIGIHAVIQLAMSGWIRAEGPYGPIFFGKYAALVALLSLLLLFKWKEEKNTVMFLLASAAVAGGVFATILSGTRGAMLALAVIMPLQLMAITILRCRKNGFNKRAAMGYLGILFIVCMMLPLTIPDTTKHRVVTAYNEFVAYVSETGPVRRDEVVNNSIGIRLEQWRVAYQLFLENPVFGVGVGNIGWQTNKQIRQGLASSAIYNKDAARDRPTHVHSAYFGALVAKGLPGLLTLIMLLAYPAYMAGYAKHGRMTDRFLVATHVAAFMVFSISEDPFIRNNFTAMYLFYMTVFMTSISSERADGE